LPSNTITLDTYIRFLPVARKYCSSECVRYFFRRSSKKMWMQWRVNDKVHDHTKFEKICTCDLYVTLKDPELWMASDFFISRRRGTHVKDGDEMLEDLAIELACTWKLHLGVFSLQRGDKSVREAIVRSMSVVGENQIPIPAPIPAAFLPRDTSFEYNYSMLALYKAYDMDYHKNYSKIDQPLEWWVKNVWKAVYNNSGIKVTNGLEWDINQDPSGDQDLRIRSLREASFFNMTFTGCIREDVRYWYSVYAQENLYPRKIPTLISKYSKPTQVVPPLMAANMHIIPKAIKMMDQYAGWDKMYKTLKWSFTKNSAFINPPLTTAFGNRPGPARKVLYEKDGVRIVKGVGGKKLEQMEWALKVLQEYVQAILLKKPYELPEAFFKIVIKSEVHLATGVGIEFFESLKKIALKAREYFIPDLLTLCMSMLVHGERQKIERGKLIRIGLNWNHGGMQFFADDFLYTTPGMLYMMFDIKGFDTSVIKALLELYSFSTSRYYTFDDPEDEFVFMELLEEITHRLTTKITQFIGNIWRVVYGVMPSGTFETSHGDSWIVALIFYCFIVYHLLNDLLFRKEFMAAYKLLKWALGVFGDDNLCAFFETLRAWFTEKNVTWFFKEFANFEIRDFVIVDHFLSELDQKGGLKNKGAVFLQKYAVDLPREFMGVDMPSVVHFRPLTTNVRKFGKGSGDKTQNIDCLLRAVSGPYDNPCNLQWYEFCRMAYNHFKKLEPNWKKKIDLVVSNKHSVVTRMIRKCHITKKDIERGFPDKGMLMSLLRKDRAKYDRSYQQDIWTMDI